MLLERDSQVIQQLGVSGLRALSAEVVHRTHDSLAEVELPHPVHEHA